MTPLFGDEQKNNVDAKPDIFLRREMSSKSDGGRFGGHQNRLAQAGATDALPDGDVASAVLMARRIYVDVVVVASGKPLYLLSVPIMLSVIVGAKKAMPSDSENRLSGAMRVACVGAAAAMAARDRARAPALSILRRRLNFLMKSATSWGDDETGYQARRACAPVVAAGARRGMASYIGIISSKGSWRR